MAVMCTDTSAPDYSTPATLMVSGASTDTSWPVSVLFHAVMRVASRAARRRTHPGRSTGHRWRGPGNRERVGTVRAVTLPDAASAALQHLLADDAQVRRQHVTDVALVDQVAGVHQRRVAARLQANDGLESVRLRKGRHLLGFCQGGAQGPLAEHRLVGVQAGHDEVFMAGHPHADNHQIDLGVLRHGVDVVERVHSVELGLRGLGRVLVGCTDRLQGVVRQEVERRDVGVGAPAAAALRAVAPTMPVRMVSAIIASLLSGLSRLRVHVLVTRHCATEASVVRRARGLIRCLLNGLLPLSQDLCGVSRGGSGETTKDSC